MTFNLLSGTITGGVTGTSMVDSFVIGAGITINGIIDGGGGMDALSLATGFTPTSANLFNNVLTLALTGGGSLTLTLASIEDFTAIPGLTMLALPLTFPAATTGADTFAITTDLTSSPAIPLVSVIDGLGETDVLQLNDGAVVASVSFNTAAPTGDGAVHLQNVETITLDGGTVNGTIDASAATGTTGITFNLVSGVAGPTDTPNGCDDCFAITGSDQNDIFIISGDITPNTNPPLDINGLIQGGGGNRDEVRLGVGGGVRFLGFFRFRDGDGDLSLRDVEIITLSGGRVDGGIHVRAAPAGVTFNLLAGQIGNRGPAFPPGFVTGSTFDDIFIIGPNIVLNGGIFSGPTFPRGLASPIGVIDGDDGMDILRLAQNFNVDEAIFLGQVLTLTFSGRRIQFTLINVEDIDIAGLITTLPSPPLLPPDYTLGTPDPFFMAGGEFETSPNGANVLEVTSLGFTNLSILGTTIEGSSIGSNFVSLNFAPQDIRQAWVDGWTGSASPVLVVDSFGAGERHGYLVMLSVLTSSVIAPLFALEAGFTEAINNFGDDGGLRAAFNDDGFAGADIRAIPFAVINASFVRNSDPVDLERRISDVERFDDFYLELIGRGVFLSAANVMDAVITKAAGNESTDAGFEPLNVAYARNASIGPRLLIVGATEGYYDQDGGVAIASYSNFAGSDPVIRARFIVANGDSPLSAAAFINGRPVSTANRGTSYAAPRVAGYVALLRHKFPNLTANYSADIILDTATYEGLSCAPDCSENIYGQGRVDIPRALAPVGSMR